jgi:hypothetical protein
VQKSTKRHECGHRTFDDNKLKVDIDNDDQTNMTNNSHDSRNGRTPNKVGAVIRESHAIEGV